MNSESNLKASSGAQKSVSNLRKVQDPQAAALKAPERHSRWIFWRHPKKPTVPIEESNLRKRACLKEPCTVCPPGQTVTATGACSSPKPVCPPGTTSTNGGQCVAQVAQQAQSCPLGRVWNGVQCVVDVNCLPGQIRVGDSCRADCISATAGAEAWINRLRSARQRRDEVCLKDPGGTECRNADLDYSGRLNEYWNFWSAVPADCTATIPVPSSI